MNFGGYLPLLGVIAYLYVARLLFAQLHYAVYGGNAQRAVCMVWFISPVTLTILAAFGENQDVLRFLDLSTMPWSLVIGDVLPLAAAIFVAAKASKDWIGHEWTLNRWWIGHCMVAGVLAGLGFHLMDSNTFEALGAGYLATALTKIWHDLVVYPIFFASLLAVGIPTVRYSRRYRWWFIGLSGVQMLLMACDAVRGLDPRNFHAPCDIACGARHGLEHLHDLSDMVLQLLHQCHII